MMRPFPYDWIYEWEERNGIELAKGARDELIDLITDMDTYDPSNK